MVAQDYPHLSVYMSVIGGILILICGVVTGGVGAAISATAPGILSVGLESLGWWSIINGIIVIIWGGYLAYSPMSRNSAYVVLVFSAVSYVAFGGFIIGGILGVAGSLWAIAWQGFRGERAEARVVVPR